MNLLFLLQMTKNGALLEILPARWSGLTLERFELEHDGNFPLCFRVVPSKEKENKC